MIETVEISKELVFKVDVTSLLYTVAPGEMADGTFAHETDEVILPAFPDQKLLPLQSDRS
ncbi:hypothetical protein D3C86_2090130 [compost metagenome]